MRPKCKFCGNEIKATHYFISKQGSVCPECQRRTKNELRSIGIKTKENSNENNNGAVTV